MSQNRLIHFSGNARRSAVVALIFCGICSIYEGYIYAMVWACYAGVALGYASFSSTFSERVFERVGYLLLIIYSYSGLFLLPFGPATFLTFLSGGATASTVMKNQTLFGLWVGGTVLFLFWYGTWSGSPRVPAFAPAIVFIAPIIILKSIFIVQQILYANKKNALAIDRAQELSEKFEEQKQVLEEQNYAYEQVSRRLEKQNKRLANQLVREGLITSELSQVEVENGQMIHAIHHDIREPIRSLVSFFQLVKRRFSKGEEHVVVNEKINESLDIGLGMVGNLEKLLLYVEEEDIGANHEYVDLNETVTKALLELQEYLHKSNAKVIVNRLPSVMGNSKQLVRLFELLIRNSIDYKNVNRKLTIRIYQEINVDGDLCVVVSDTGSGIPEHELGQIFGLLFRGVNSHGTEGAGIGLALCKRIIIAHEATISFESQIGLGTNAVLCFSNYEVKKQVKVIANA